MAVMGGETWVLRELGGFYVVSMECLCLYWWWFLCCFNGMFVFVLVYVYVSKG